MRLARLAALARRTSESARLELANSRLGPESEPTILSLRMHPPPARARERSDHEPSTFRGASSRKPASGDLEPSLRH